MTKPFVFTLMPFSNSFDDVYKLGIKATCEELNSYCERVDEQIFQGSILDRIFNQIAKADVIIADMTGRNSNVFFEVGYAKALDKKLILLTSSSDDIPFDLKHYAHVVYDSSIVKLKESLKQHLLYYFSNPDKKQSEMNVGVNFYICGTKLIEGSTTKVDAPMNYHYIPITVENVSGKTLDTNSLQIVAHANDPWVFGNRKNKKYIMDRENIERWSLNNDSPLFHGSEQTYELCTPPRNEKEIKTVEIDAFTNNGRCSYIVEMIGKAANK